MPVEIKELIIRAVVRPDTESETAASPAPAASSAPGDNEAIVDACVKQVLQILRSGQER